METDNYLTREEWETVRKDALQKKKYYEDLIFRVDIVLNRMKKKEK